jgi:hypothetical protein
VTPPTVAPLPPSGGHLPTRLLDVSPVAMVASFIGSEITLDLALAATIPVTR